MLMNLKDPESIVAWWKVFPDQHDNYLSHKLKVSPEFAPAIVEAQRRIANDPALSSLRPQVQARWSQDERADEPDQAWQQELKAA